MSWLMIESLTSLFNSFLVSSAALNSTCDLHMYYLFKFILSTFSWKWKILHVSSMAKSQNNNLIKSNPGRWIYLQASFWEQSTGHWPQQSPTVPIVLAGIPSGKHLKGISHVRASLRSEQPQARWWNQLLQLALAVLSPQIKTVSMRVCTCFAALGCHNQNPWL